MKTLTLLLTLVFLTQTAFAEAEPPKSDLEVIIRAMAEQYAKSAVQDLAIQELKTQAAKALGEHMATQIGDAAFNILAIVGLVQNVQAYDQATTEGGKYSAAAHAAANAISVAFAPIPIVGLMVNLAVLGQDLMAAFVSKDFILEQARMRLEISRIYKETSDIQIKQYNAELKAMTALTTRLGAITLLSDQGAQQHAANCLKEDFDFKTPEACLMSLLTLEQLISKQLHTMGMILNFKGRLLNFQSLGVNSKAMQDLYTKAEIQLKEISSSIRYALNQVVFNQVWDLKNQQEKEMVFRRCEASVLIKLKQILSGKKEVLQSSRDDIWKVAELEEHKMDLQTLLKGVCSDYFLAAPVNLKEIIASTLPRS
jgi:hypothetical protein